MSKKSIYSLGVVELKTFKTYIQTNLINNLIQLSNFLVKTPIIFIKKSNSSPFLFISYWSLDNITIKNQYLPLLISKLPNHWVYAKWFNSFNLVDTYHLIELKKDNKGKIIFKIWYSYFEYQTCYLDFCIYRQFF